MRKAISDEQGVRVQVEHAPHPARDLEENPEILGNNLEFKLWFANDRFDLEKSQRVFDAENPLKTISYNAFNSRDRMRPIELTQSLPIVRRSEGKF